MTVLVTGGTGFLGLRLVQALLARGENVHAVVRGGRVDPRDRLVEALAATGAPAEMLDRLPQTLTVVEGDVAEPRLGLSDADYTALTSDVDAIWHSAALTNLQDEPGKLNAVNVDGTANVLRLAESTPAAAIYYLGTAFVAGSTQGIVTEDQFKEPEYFENPYEASKYAAEQLVRDWARSTGRPVTIFRPSILVSDRTPLPGAPPHTFQQIANLGRHLLAGGIEARTLRFPGNPDGHLNLMPVEAAVEMMLGANGSTARPADDAVRAYHVVHPRDTPHTTIAEAIEATLPPLSAAIVAERPADPNELESIVYDALSGFLGYGYHTRRFATGRLGRTGVQCSPIDLDYLVRSMRPVDDAAASSAAQ